MFLSLFKQFMFLLYLTFSFSFSCDLIRTFVIALFHKVMFKQLDSEIQVDSSVKELLNCVYTPICVEIKCSQLDLVHQSFTSFVRFIDIIYSGNMFRFCSLSIYCLKCHKVVYTRLTLRHILEKGGTHIRTIYFI